MITIKFYYDAKYFENILNSNGEFTTLRIHDKNKKEARRAFNVYESTNDNGNYDNDIKVKRVDEFLKNFVENNIKNTNVFELKDIELVKGVRREKNKPTRVDMLIEPEDREKFFKDLIDIDTYVFLSDYESNSFKNEIQSVIDKYSNDLEIIKNKRKSRGVDMFELKDLENLIFYEKSDTGEYRKNEDIVKIFNGYLSSFENDEDRKTYKDTIIDFNNLMSDDYYGNLKSQIFDKLIAGDKDFSNFSEYENLLWVLKDDEYLLKESELLKYSFSDFCDNERIFSRVDLEEIIDNDLKEKGFDSFWIFTAGDYLRASHLDKNADYVQLDAYDYTKMLSVEQASDLYRDSINEMNLDDLLVLSEIQKSTDTEVEKKVEVRRLRM